MVCCGAVLQSVVSLLEQVEKTTEAKETDPDTQSKVLLLLQPAAPSLVPRPLPAVPWLREVTEHYLPSSVGVRGS